jgi:hypothetical protein
VRDSRKEQDCTEGSKWSTSRMTLEYLLKKMNECGRSMTRNLGEEGRWNFQNRRK